MSCEVEGRANAVQHCQHIETFGCALVAGWDVGGLGADRTGQGLVRG